MPHDTDFPPPRPNRPHKPRDTPPNRAFVIAGVIAWIIGAWAVVTATLPDDPARILVAIVAYVLGLAAVLYGLGDE